ncbi:peptidyl-prolyl cis-trans isomerase E [Dichotomocladium elegans]|nr:peptidyl-prolyl cis-trans isomerase E [Dichotomocladium elegans]
MANNNNESKSTVYVGGLDQDMTEELLHAAFIPFGDIVSVQLAVDPGTHNQHKGYGFVEFEEEADCDAAIDNMHQAELHGKVIKVNKAKPHRVLAGSNRAVWSDDAWLQQHAMPKDEPAVEAQSPTNPPPPSP